MLQAKFAFESGASLTIPIRDDRISQLPHYLIHRFARAGGWGFIGEPKRHEGDQFARLTQPLKQLLVGDEHDTNPQRPETHLFVSHI